MSLSVWTVAAVSAVLSAGAGYFTRVLVERHQTRVREQAHRALGGELPDWEIRARELETRAHNAVLGQRVVDQAAEGAAVLRREADLTRARGRARDKEWT